MIVSTDEQRDFAESLHALLADGDAIGAARAWALDDAGPGLALWDKLSELGVTSLARADFGAEPLDWVIACEELGHHAMPGPVAETVAVAPLLADVSGLATVAMPPLVPYAVDASVADSVLLVTGSDVALGVLGGPGAPLASVDRTRRLFPVSPGAVVASDVDAKRAFDAGALATAAQLLGLGRALLETTVAYARQRVQFGHPIGSYQAVKHQLADVLIGLKFAAPLVWKAALTFSPIDISAAKVASATAADRAARTGLQVHGAIGYTLECDVGVFLTRVRALIPAWGTPSWHRARIGRLL